MVAAAIPSDSVRLLDDRWRRVFLLRRPLVFGVCVAVAVATSFGCAARTVPPPTGPASEPRASWIIKAGDYGNEREVCRSDVNRMCILPASSTQKPVSVSISVFLFPAEGPTTFQGAFLSGFMASANGQGYESKVDYKTVPGDPPTAVNVTGRVTQQPGDYPFRMALLAAVPGHTDPHQFQQTFNVRVAPPTSTGD